MLIIIIYKQFHEIGLLKKQRLERNFMFKYSAGCVHCQHKISPLGGRNKTLEKAILIGPTRVKLQHTLYGLGQARRVPGG